MSHFCIINMYTLHYTDISTIFQNNFSSSVISIVKSRPKIQPIRREHYPARPSTARLRVTQGWGRVPCYSHSSVHLMKPAYQHAAFSYQNLMTIIVSLHLWKRKYCQLSFCVNLWHLRIKTITISTGEGFYNAQFWKFWIFITTHQVVTGSLVASASKLTLKHVLSHSDWRVFWEEVFSARPELQQEDPAHLQGPGELRGQGQGGRGHEEPLPQQGAPNHWEAQVRKIPSGDGQGEYWRHRALTWAWHFVFSR